MKFKNQQLVEWLKTQRHRKGKIGQLGYMLSELGICWLSKQYLLLIKRAYLRRAQITNHQ